MTTVLTPPPSRREEWELLLATAHHFRTDQAENGDEAGAAQTAAFVKLFELAADGCYGEPGPILEIALAMIHAFTDEAERAETIETWRAYVGLPVPPARPHTVVLCGSTRFMHAFQEANLRETLADRIVLTVGCDTRSEIEYISKLTATDLRAALALLEQR